MPIPLASSEVETALPYELQIASYVALVVLTVRRGSVTFGGGLGKCSLIHQQSYTWDWILSIPEEYEILQSVGLNRPIAVYYLSRFVCSAHAYSTAIHISPLSSEYLACAIASLNAREILILRSRQAG